MLRGERQKRTQLVADSHMANGPRQLSAGPHGSPSCRRKTPYSPMDLPLERQLANLSRTLETHSKSIIIRETELTPFALSLRMFQSSLLLAAPSMISLCLETSLGWPEAPVE